MPGGDGRGPAGKGPRTGRGLGNCTSSTGTKRTFFGFGRGRSRAKGLGSRMFNRFHKENRRD
jgi:hypothetical protein